MTTAPLTEQQLDEITARTDATRSGPWILSDDLEGDGYPGHLWVVRTPDSGPDEPDDQAVVISIGDRALGEFIAHAREDVPALLAEVDRLKGQRQFLLDQLARKDAATGEGDRKLREFLSGEPTAENAAPAPAPAPLTASHSPAGDRDGETGAEGATDPLSDSALALADADPNTLLRHTEHYLSVSHHTRHDTLAANYGCAGCELRDAIQARLTGATEEPKPAEDFTGTQPCGHDDYHPAHPWHDWPNTWCPGHSHDDDQATTEESAR